jgi:hypothetical protein
MHLSSEASAVAPPPLVDRRPCLVAPACNRGVVALVRSAHDVAETANMGGMVYHAPCHPHPLDHPLPSPDLATEPLGFGTTVQEVG